MSRFKSIKRDTKILVFILIFMVFILTQIYTYVATKDMEKHMLTENVRVTHNGKEVFKGNIDDYTLKNVKSEDNLTMYMTIPKNTLKYPAIQFDNINTGVIVYVDGKEIYRLGQDTPKGGLVCHSHTKVPLGKVKAGQKLKMSVRVLSSSSLTRLPRIKLMDTMDIDKEFLVTSLDNVIYSAFLFVIGIIGILIVANNGVFDKINKKIFILSILGMASAVSIISTYQIFQIFSDNVVLDMLCEYVNRFVFLSLTSLYMYENVDNKKKKKVFAILAVFNAIYGVVSVVLQQMKIVYMNDTLMFSCLIVLILLYFTFVSLWEKMDKDQKKKFLIFFSAIAVGIIVLTLLLYVFCMQMSADVFMYFPEAQIIMITILFIEIIYGLSESYISDAEAQAMEKIAYIDGLTGLYNRRALKKYEDKMKQSKKAYKIYSIDVNDLKKINDTYGHSSGDTLLKAFAYNLKSVFINAFCVRTGGDEFIMIVSDEIDSEKTMEKLKGQIKKENDAKKYEFNIRFAYGYALYDPQKESNIEDIINQADENMYCMKKSMKKNMES